MCRQNQHFEKIILRRIFFFSILLIISAFNVLLLNCMLYRHTYTYRLYTIIYLFILYYFTILINMLFLF